MKSILVSRTDRIGDLILSTPVFETLKKSYPDCHLGVLVNEGTEELLRHSPWVDEIICYKLSNFFQLIRTLRKFEVAIILYPLFTIAFLCWLSRIKLRIGTAYRYYSFFFNRKVKQHRKYCRTHEAECNVKLLRPLGIERSSITPRIWFSKAEREWARQRLKELRARGMIAALHPGSGGSSRRWSEENFATLGDILSENGFEVLLTGSVKETELIEHIISRMKSSPIKVVGETSLLRLAALFTLCKVLITNSTGPMHLAASCEIPVIGIFCPIAGCSPQRWAPLGRNTGVLIPDVPVCQKCVLRRCEHYDCMNLITPEMVLRKVQQLLIDSEEGDE